MHTLTLIALFDMQQSIFGKDTVTCQSREFSGPTLLQHTCFKSFSGENKGNHMHMSSIICLIHILSGCQSKACLSNDAILWKQSRPPIWKLRSSWPSSCTWKPANDRTELSFPLIVYLERKERRLLTAVSYFKPSDSQWYISCKDSSKIQHAILADRASRLWRWWHWKTRRQLQR